MAYDDAERPTRVREIWTGGSDSTFQYDRTATSPGARRTGRSPGTSTSRTRLTAVTAGRPASPMTCSIARRRYPSPRTGRRRARRPPPAPVRHAASTSPRQGLEARATTASEEPSTGTRRESRMRRQRPSDAAATFSKDQEYTYHVDANRTKDERGTHVYNARDQLVQWTRAGDRRYGGSSVSYTVDGAGRVELVQDSSPLPDRDPEYQGERVDFERVEGITIDHAYDVFGSVKSISGGGFTQTFEYDGLERIIKDHEQPRHGGGRLLRLRRARPPRPQGSGPRGTVRTRPRLLLRGAHRAALAAGEDDGEREGVVLRLRLRAQPGLARDERDRRQRPLHLRHGHVGLDRGPRERERRPDGPLLLRPVRRARAAAGPCGRQPPARRPGRGRALTGRAGQPAALPGVRVRQRHRRDRHARAHVQSAGSAAS